MTQISKIRFYFQSPMFEYKIFYLADIHNNMADQLRANNESYLVSSIYQSAESEDRQSNPVHYRFNKSIVPSAVDFDTQVQMTNPNFNQTFRAEVPRKSFSWGGFVKLEVSYTGDPGALFAAMFADGKDVHNNLGFLNAVDEITLETRKEVLYRMKQNSLYTWLESQEEELRDAYKLVMLQGVKDDLGTAPEQLDLSGATIKLYHYIPLSIFPPFRDHRQSLQLDFIEPVQVVIRMKASTSLNASSGDRLTSGLTSATILSAVLNTSHFMLDNDALNKYYKMLEGQPKLQRISEEYYENVNVIEDVDSTEKGVKIEGVHNATKLCLVARNSNGKVVDITSVRLTDGNKDLLNYNGVENKILAYRGLKGFTYSDTKVQEIDFSVVDGDLHGESYGGSLSFNHMIDPRIHVKTSETANVHIVARQLSTVHINTASGSVQKGSSD